MGYWFADHDNLVCLSNWMYGMGYFENIAAVLHFLEKPWHYEDYWKEYQKSLEE